jgi:VWFA-related protein
VSVPVVAQAPAYAVEITSPLGRSGLPGKVRIVARVTHPDGHVPAVRFFVDEVLLATDVDGPPFAAEWEDLNPFERARLTIEVDDPTGVPVRASIELPSYDYIEESSVLSVGLEASVQDAQGRFVGGLDTGRFRLYENDTPQEIDSLSADPAPATFALLVDASHSMSRNITFVRRAAASLTRYLREIDSVIIAPFRSGITTVTGPTRDTTTILEAVDAIAPEGGTAILDALRDLAERFGDGPGRRVAILITDGYDEKSELLEEDVLDSLKASRVTVYVISIGGVAGVSIRGERLLRRIATETGGRAFFPWDQKQLEESHAIITGDVKHQYRLTYTPRNQTQDGTWREIRLETDNSDHRVRARPGYRAPEPPPVRASIEFTVTDEARQYVDLSASAITVSEDGVPQRVDVFTEAVAPVSILLALDGSGSMRRAAETARDAAHAFIRALRDDDPLGVLVFADAVEVAHDLTTKREVSHEAVEAYSTSGGTALYDALVEGSRRLRSVKGRRALVVVSDGRDENAASNGPGSLASWDEALAAAAADDITVYAIGLGARVDRERLERLAAATGGETYFTEEVAELEGHYQRIVEELHRRYVIGYTSTNSARDGGWRQVSIEVPDGLSVRSRGGYFAPGTAVAQARTP